MSNDELAIELSSPFDSSNNDVNDSKIANVVSCNNGDHDAVSNKNDTGAAPTGNAVASESCPSALLTDTNAQSTMKVLAEDCNSVPLSPIPATA